MTDQPWKPEPSDPIGTLGDDAVFMSFTEPPTKHQLENPVDEFPFDIREELGGWNLVVCLHIKVGKFIINLQALGARAGVPSRYTASTLQGNG